MWQLTFRYFFQLISVKIELYSPMINVVKNKTLYI